MFKPSHYLVLVTLLGAVGAQVLTLKSWGDATSPAFVAGLLLSLASGLGGLFLDKPRDPLAFSRSTDH